jgi:hypothetical protein
MRWVFRLFFLLMFLGGLGAGIVYPWMSANLVGREFGSWTVFGADSGFVPVTTELPGTGVPVTALLDIRLNGPLVLASPGALLTFSGTVDGQEVIARAITLSEIRARLVDPQSGELQATVEVGRITSPQRGVHVFTVGPGTREQHRLMGVTLTLEQGLGATPPYLQPAGFAAMSIGFIAFVLSFRTRARPANPNSQPPKPRWGRGS